MQLFGLVGDRLNEQLKKILKEEVRDDELDVFKKVKLLYSNCMDKGEGGGFEKTTPRRRGCLLIALS